MAVPSRGGIKTTFLEGGYFFLWQAKQHLNLDEVEKLAIA